MYTSLWSASLVSFLSVSYGFFSERIGFGYVDTDILNVGLFFLSLYFGKKEQKLPFLIAMLVSYLWYPKFEFIGLICALICGFRVLNTKPKQCRWYALTFVLIMLVKDKLILNNISITSSIKELFPLSTDVIPVLLGIETELHWLGFLLGFFVILRILYKQEMSELCIILFPLWIISASFGMKYFIYLIPIFWLILLSPLNRISILLVLGTFCIYGQKPLFTGNCNEGLVFQQLNIYDRGTILAWWTKGTKIEFYSEHKNLISSTQPNHPNVKEVAAWFLSEINVARGEFVNGLTYAFIDQKTLSSVQIMDFLLHPEKKYEDLFYYEIFDCGSRRSFEQCRPFIQSTRINDVGMIYYVKNGKSIAQKVVNKELNTHATCFYSKTLQCTLYNKELEYSNIHRRFFHYSNYIVHRDFPNHVLTLVHN